MEGFLSSGPVARVRPFALALYDTIRVYVNAANFNQLEHSPMKFDWKDVLHYGTGLTAIAVGAVSWLGAAIPGVTVSDPKMCMTFGLGIIVAGLKGGLISK